MARAKSDQPRLRVLVIGGSYAGLSAAVNLANMLNTQPSREDEGPHMSFPRVLDQSVEITVIDERDGFYHLVGAPLALVSMRYAQKSWTRYEDIPELHRLSIKIVQGTVTEVACHDKKISIMNSSSKQPLVQPYDILITASGLRRVWPIAPQAKTKHEFLHDTMEHISSFQDAPHGVVVVGGGAVGVEMAAELKMVMPELDVTLVHSRDSLLSSEPLPETTKEKTLEILREAGVNVLMNHRLTIVTENSSPDGRVKYCVEFSNGEKIDASRVVRAISKSVPSTEFLPTSATDDEGYVKTLPNLTFQTGTPNHEDHFSVGDMVRWSGIKRCGGAMHMGQVVAHNVYQRILQKLTGQTPIFKTLKDFPPMITIAVGENAVSYGPHSGTTWGPDVLETFFDDDLSLSYCWETMKLNGPPQTK